MNAFETISLLLSAGTLTGVARVVWILSRHDTLHEQHLTEFQHHENEFRIINKRLLKLEGVK